MRDKLLSIAQSIRLPSICVLCNQFNQGSNSICNYCIDLLPTLGPSCTHCAQPLFQEDYLICGHCIKNPPYFDRALVKYPFEEPLRTLLHRFKYHNALYLGSFLSQLILNAWNAGINKPQSSSQPQCLIPVPMHPKKLKLRGFNQSVLLAQFLAKKLKIPYDFRSCEKIVNTKAQASLDGEQRQKNLKGAFRIDPLPYEHIAIVDDLLTTGSTANELARTLKNSGVKQVDIWCCARTIL